MKTILQVVTVALLLAAGASALAQPTITNQPQNVTNLAGTTAVFLVGAEGTPSLAYQWWFARNGLSYPLGAHTNFVMLNNVLGGDTGAYWVVVANPAGSVTSQVATLTVIDPVINQQPASQVVNAGDNVRLSVTATGTPPLNYQWRKDGAAQGGATQSSLTLTNLHEPNGGGYDILVSSSWGTVTSSVSVLTVNLALPDSFAPEPYYPGDLTALAIQADGKILLGGSDGWSGGFFERFDGDGTTAL